MDSDRHHSDVMGHSAEDTPACPVPWKVRYGSRAAAKQAMKEAKRLDRIKGNPKPYRCGDHWHTSTMSGSRQKQVGTRSKRARTRA